MFKQLDYTMVTVSDMDRSIEFYRDRLGLNLKMQSPEWTEFETGQTTLALHGGGTQQERTQPAMEGCKMAGTCSIGFNVENVEQTYDLFRATLALILHAASFVFEWRRVISNQQFPRQETFEAGRPRSS